MEEGPENHHHRFAAVRAGLSREVDNGIKLIEELLEELNSTKILLNQTKLDLDNEREGRRRVQQQVKESEQLSEIQERRPFMVLLIDADADGYVFHDRFISRGVKGGEDAADALQAELQRYAPEVIAEPNRIDVIVKAFANIGGLSGALERSGKLRDKNLLRAFAAGFSGRQALFDFVDIGAGKERADHKVRESIKFYLESFQCKHVMLGCCHDAGYVPTLGQFLSDKQVAARITLVQGTPLPQSMRDLGLKTIELNSIFSTLTQTTTPGEAMGQNIRPITTGFVPDPRSVLGRPVAMASGTLPTTNGGSWAQAGRLGPVLTDQAGRRMDRQLQVDVMTVERIKKEGLCYYKFLRGECVSTKCNSKHEFRPLTDHEFDALWARARQGQCNVNRNAQNGGNDCADPKCIYGHRMLDQSGVAAVRT